MNINNYNFSNNIQYRSFQKKTPISFRAQNYKQEISQNQQSRPNNQPAKLSIGYINDFHGQLTKMERTILPLKKADIRVTGGDTFLGDERNISLNKGVVKFLNMADYEASPIGNHELDMDQKSLLKLDKR